MTDVEENRKKVMTESATAVSKTDSMDTPKVSVIIPMYKCEDFVDGLFDMVCGQSFRETEIICVLDGPDEGIRGIVEARQKEDDRIILLEQEHAGAGAARNKALERAHGDYLLFLDADDLFENNLIERLYREAVKWNADTVMCSYVQTNGWLKTSTTGLGFNYSVFPEGCVIDPAEMEEFYRHYIGAPWNKMFRRQMIVDNHLSFSSTRVMNDEFFVLTAMTYTRRLAVIKEDLLTVRRYINNDSISSNRARYTEDTLVVLDQIYCWLRNNGYWKKRKEDYFAKCKHCFDYNLGYDFNEKYVDGLAYTLSRKQPWKRMCNAEIIDIFELKTGKLKERRKALANTIEVLGDKDPMGQRQQLKIMDNRIKAIKSIRALMKSRYGRDMSKRGNPVRLITWSLRKDGLKATAKKISNRLHGEVEICPTGVVCAGHLTSGCSNVTFFLPVQVDRESVKVEDLSVAVRCNGYYLKAVSGRKHDVLTELGPAIKPIVSGGVSTRRGEVDGVVATVSQRLGINIQVRFALQLLRNNKGDKAHNNQPVSVLVSGKIRLK